MAIGLSKTPGAAAYQSPRHFLFHKLHKIPIRSTQMGLVSPIFTSHAREAKFLRLR